MKNIGMLIFIGGLILLGYAFTMDTSVAVDYPDGNSYGLPDRVNNIGLMADKQNYLIFGAILSVLGIVAVITSDKKKEKEEAEKKCPKCAEMVKKEALICRFCKHEFNDNDGDNNDDKVYETDEEAERIIRNLNRGVFN